MPVTNYIWDEANDSLLMETDENGQTTAEYTHDPGPGGGLVSERRGNESHFYHYDGLGSTRQLTDATGQVTDTFTYDAFGSVIQRSGGTMVPYHFVGRQGYYQDEELGEYYVRAREYDPGVARWLTADPLSFIDKVMHAYAYTANGPTNRTDPSGLKDVSVTIPGVNNSQPINLTCDKPPPPKPGQPWCDVIHMKELAEPKKSQCEKARDDFRNNDKVIGLILAALKRHGCRVPDILCRCCTDRCEAAGAWFLKGNAYICGQRTLNSNDILDLIRHEFTHSYQECTGFTGTSCALWLAAELQANLCAGVACTDFASCLPRAVWSACYVEACQPQELQTQVVALYNWYRTHRDRMCTYQR